MRLKLILLVVVVILLAIFISINAPYPMEPRPPREVTEAMTKKPPKRITVLAAPCRIVPETRRLVVKRGSSVTLRLTLIGIREETVTVHLIASYGEEVPGFISLIVKGIIPKEKFIPRGMKVSFDRDKIVLSKGEEVKVKLNILISPTFKKGAHILAITACAKAGKVYVGATTLIRLIVED